MANNDSSISGPPKVAKGEKSGLWDLEDQFAFYGQYHANKTNVLIHVVVRHLPFKSPLMKLRTFQLIFSDEQCVPTIFWTFLVLLNKLLPWHTTMPVLFGPLKVDVIVNASFLLALGYALYFIGLEPVAGTLYAPILLFMGYSANEFYANNAKAMSTAGYFFTAAWIAQFIGHGKFEGRAPALLDSLFQSLVLAVFFVFMEVLFYAGYKPQLHRRLQNRIGKEVLAYRQAKKRQGKPDDKAVGQQTIFRA